MRFEDSANDWVNAPVAHVCYRSTDWNEYWRQLWSYL